MDLLRTNAEIHANHAASTIIWIALWSGRPKDDVSGWEDLYLFILFQIWSTRWAIFTLLRPILHAAAVFAISVAIFVVLLTSIALSRSLRSHRLEKWDSVDSTKPLIIRCRTTHSRMFPKRHTFSYRYLQVSVPVSFTGSCSRVLSVGQSSTYALFHVDASDYLIRGSKNKTLQGKLTEYLESQDIHRYAWQNAYLVTAPRFLGYSFNPVSFWYIYDHSDELSWMVLEVNNTFDERRMYLVNCSMENRRSKTSDSPSWARGKWAKDFHVSPFNSRKGDYTFTALNAFRDGLCHFPGIDNKIVLSSSKGHIKLVAQLFSDDVPIIPQKMDWGDCSVFLAQWCWLGIFTFPRILKEAILLFFWHHLYVWFRPEVKSSSIGRRATSTEKLLELYLSQYLQSFVRGLKVPVRMEYHSGFGPSRIFESSHQSSNNNIEKLSLQILSPTFFSRYPRYPTVFEAFMKESLIADERKRTVYISDPALLACLCATEMSIKLTMPQIGALERFRWGLIRFLRSIPADFLRDTFFKDQSSKQIGMQIYNPIDIYVASNSSSPSIYRRKAIQELLASKLLYGSSTAVAALDLTIRVGLMSTVASEASCKHLLQPNILPFAVHVWAFAKG